MHTQHRVLKAAILSALMCASVGLSACASFTPVPKVSAAKALTSGNYSLDKTHAALLVRINHFGISSYVGRFNDFDVVLDFDADNPTAAKLQATVQTNSLDVNNADFERRLIGKDWLDSGAFPEAVFTLDNVEVTGGNTGLARGQLTLRGITMPVTFETQFIGGLTNPITRKYTIGLEAHGEIKRSDYGIDKYLSIAGDKFDFDTVRLEFNGEFQLQERKT